MIICWVIVTIFTINNFNIVLFFEPVYNGHFWIFAKSNIWAHWGLVSIDGFFYIFSLHAIYFFLVENDILDNVATLYSHVFFLRLFKKNDFLGITLQNGLSYSKWLWMSTLSSLIVNFIFQPHILVINPVSK